MGTSPPSTRPSAALCSREKAVRPPRAADAVGALRELGCDVTLVPTRHPVVDIVPFQLLTIDLAEARGVDPGPDPLGRPALEARPRLVRMT